MFVILNVKKTLFLVLFNLAISIHSTVPCCGALVYSEEFADIYIVKTTTLLINKSTPLKDRLCLSAPSLCQYQFYSTVLTSSNMFISFIMGLAFSVKSTVTPFSAVDGMGGGGG